MFAHSLALNALCRYRLMAALLFILALGLTACGGGGGGTFTTGAGPQIAATPGNEVVFGGSVGDGPVTGASVKIYSSKGHVLGTIVSDSKASYQARIRPQSDDYPLHLVASGGTDLVTGKTPDFRMESVKVRAKDAIVNINPFSTMITQVAKKLPGGISSSNINTARTLVMNRLTFGLDRSTLSDPITSPLTSGNVAQLVKASEAFGEAVRRTRDMITSTGQPITGDGVLRALAADMVDGHPDGLGAGGTSPTVTAVFNVVRGQVLVEALSNNLRVGGLIATVVIDQSLRSTYAGLSSSQLTRSVRVTADMLAETRTALSAAKVLDQSAQVAGIVQAVNGLSAGASAASVGNILAERSSYALNNVVNTVARVSLAQINAVNLAVYASGGNTVANTGTGSGTPPASNPSGTKTGSLSLRWTAPASRSDGTALSLSSIGGYRIYYGTSKGNYPNTVNVKNGSATATTINNLVPGGTYHLVMTTYDSVGRESARSPNVVKNAL